jgi:hypothetical protein
MEESKFYVFNPKGCTPTVYHSKIELATAEAERIAKLTPNTEIVVLRAIVGVTYPAKEYIYRNYKK